MQFMYDKIVCDSGYVNYIDGLAIYEAYNDSELDNFYFVYRMRGYDNFEIDSVEKDNYIWGSFTYRVEMHKRYELYFICHNGIECKGMEEQMTKDAKKINEIKRVVKLGTIYKQYWVELCKKVDADSDSPYGYIWNIEMLLDITNNGGHE